MGIDVLEQEIDTNKKDGIESGELINFLKKEENVQRLGESLQGGFLNGNERLYQAVYESTINDCLFQENIGNKVIQGEQLTNGEIFLLYIQSLVDVSCVVKPQITKNGDVYIKYGGMELLGYIRGKYGNPRYEFYKGWPSKKQTNNVGNLMGLNQREKQENTKLPRIEMPDYLENDAQGDGVDGGEGEKIGGRKETLKYLYQHELQQLEIWAKQNFSKEYSEESIASRKRNGEKGERINDYVQMDMYIFSLKKYSELVDEKLEHEINTVYSTEEEYREQQELSEKYYKEVNKVREEEFSDINLTMESLEGFFRELQEIEKECLKGEKGEEAERKYKEYMEEMGIRMEEMGLEDLGKMEEPKDGEDAIDFCRNMNTLMQFWEEQETIKRKYGDSVDNYENFMEKRAELIGSYGQEKMKEDMDIYGKYQKRIEEIKEIHKNFDVKKYEEWMQAISKSGLEKHVNNVKKLGECLDVGNENFPIKGIKEEYEVERKIQEMVDTMWEMLKSKNKVLYGMCNIMSRGINSFIGNTWGSGVKLGAMVTRLWHDDDEMVAVMERAGSKGWNPGLRMSRKQSQSIYEDGKIVLNWDNGPGIVAESMVTMGILVLGGGVISKGVAKGAMKIGVNMGAKVAGGIGLVSSGFLQQIGNSFKEGFDVGMTGNQALLYSMVSAGLQSGLELISPNEFINGLGKNLAKTYIKEILKTESKQSLKAVGKLFLKNVGSEVLEENIQEAIQLTAGNLVNMWANDKFEITGSGGLEADWNPKNFLATAIITTLTTGVMAGGGFAMQTPGMGNKDGRAQLIEEIKNNRGLHKDVMEVLDKAIEGKIKIPDIDINGLKDLKMKLDGVKISNSDYFGGKSHRFDVTETQARRNSEMMDNFLNEINEQNESEKLNELRKEISEQYKQITGEKLNFTDEQLRSILDAHEQDGILGELTVPQLRKKVTILREAVKDKNVIRFLLEAGFCGQIIDYEAYKKGVENIKGNTSLSEDDIRHLLLLGINIGEKKIQDLIIFCTKNGINPVLYARFCSNDLVGNGKLTPAEIEKRIEFVKKIIESRDSTIDFTKIMNMNKEELDKTMSTYANNKDIRLKEEHGDDVINSEVNIDVYQISAKNKLSKLLSKSVDDFKSICSLSIEDKNIIIGNAKNKFKGNKDWLNLCLGRRSAWDDEHFDAAQCFMAEYLYDIGLTYYEAHYYVKNFLCDGIDLITKLDTIKDYGKCQLQLIPDDIFSKEKIVDVLLKIGFMPCGGGCYVSNMELSNKITCEAGEKYKVITENDINIMYYMINIGEHREYWKNLTPDMFLKNFYRFKDMFIVNPGTRKSIIGTEGEDFFDKLVSDLENSDITEDEKTVIADFVSEGFKYINRSLRENRPDSSYRRQQARILHDFIQRHPVDKTIKLNRTDRDPHRFDEVVLNNGITLTQILNNFDQYIDKIDAINGELAHNPSHNKQFLSASIGFDYNPMGMPYGNTYAGINRKIYLEKGSHAIFRNMYSGTSLGELEYIIQDGSNITYQIEIIEIQGKKYPQLIGYITTIGDNALINS